MSDPKPKSHSSKTPSPVLGGMEAREAAKLWKSIAESMARINLMRSLIKEKVGLAEIEEFSLDLSSKFRSYKFKNGSHRSKYDKSTEKFMKLKLADDQHYHRDLCKARTKTRSEIAEKLGNNSRPFRRMMSELKNEENARKIELTKKYKNKVNHLKTKYKEDKNKISQEEDVPEDLQEFSELTIFNKKRYQEILEDSYEVTVIGNVDLTVAEEKVLKLHPKFCVTGRLQEQDFEHEQQAALAKVRMEMVKIQEQTEMTQEEIQEEQELEAKTRQVFDPLEKVYDSRKRRVTDLRECSRITLPRPLSPEDEAVLKTRKRSQMEIFREYIAKNTNKKGDLKSNLTDEENEGLKSLQKRIAKGDLIVMKTDKSGKFAITTQEKYLEMGQDHVKSDKKITRAEVIEIEKTLNGHTRAWANIWQSGQDHKHFERIVSSKTTRSENVADLYLMYKDHKKGHKTRPTATGCTSNTLGLSNSVAEVLEAVANSEKDRYNTISSEDMLARIHTSNKKISINQEKWYMARIKKLQCNKCKIMENVDCSNTEDHKWEDIIPPVDINTEDLEKYEKSAQELVENECCKQEIEDRLAYPCESCGPGIANWDITYCLIGNDVKALYPSIESEPTGRIIRKRIENTELEFEGFCEKKALAYIAMNKDLTTEIEEIEHLLHTRRSGRDTKLKISAILGPRRQV